MTESLTPLPPRRFEFFHHLYFWVVLGIVFGGVLGAWVPDFAVTLKPLGDGFIALIKMLIGPVIFCTIVLGISGAGDMKRVGRVGAKALLYFEVVSTFALMIGLTVANGLKPGRGFQVDPNTLTSPSVTEFTQRASEQSTIQFLLGVIPRTFLDAFSGNGDLLQILLVAVLFGFSMNRLGHRAEPVHRLIESGAEVFFGMVNSVMKLAPIGAGAAMAFTIGKYGVGSLSNLAYLMFCFYLTCFLFVFGVLGLIARFAGFSLWRYLRYTRQELFTVLGTSSSESA
ncbi:MAG: cation:dicarboxylase symporter family transporter, partial [Proteobacteria bacterium]